MATQHPVMDVKLHNSGGNTAILKRLTVEALWAKRFAVLPDLVPYVDPAGPAMMSPSAMYEVRLPAPEDAADARITLGVSHLIAPDDADRIQIRLITQFPPNETAAGSEPGATFVYLLRLVLLYNADDQELSSRTIGVACPGNVVFLPTEEGLRRKIRRFQTKVDDIRKAIDKEMASRGQTPPEWLSRPPRRREDLPRRLSILDRRQLNDRFWNPRDAVARYLDDAEQLCREITETLTPEMPDGLGEIIPAAHATLAQIPMLRKDFGVSSRADGGPK